MGSKWGGYEEQVGGVWGAKEGGENSSALFLFFLFIFFGERASIIFRPDSGETRFFFFDKLALSMYFVERDASAA
jgi:hypothetical protein